MIVYLGVELNSVTMRAPLAEPRIEALSVQLCRVRPRSVVAALSVTRLLGIMSAAHMPSEMVRSPAHRSCAQEEAHDLCSYFSGSRSDSMGNPQHSGRGSSPQQTHLTPIGVHRRRSVGMGRNVSVSGGWSTVARRHDSSYNVLELLTVLAVTQHFDPLLKGQHVLIHTDNRVVAAYGRRALRSAVKHRQTAAGLGACKPALDQSGVHPQRRPSGFEGHFPPTESVVPPPGLEAVCCFYFRVVNSL
ncbi:uncharacterized protein LOC106941355 [Poecilia latipinna]|uniref:uncharacterized protein LOC106941355 n=1 Tax=Poecilia latipinna TaxID=48699 RepID=UPI00072EDFCA|nr:PREDICTED: uncharacterized protein LOC106941355 [Poecilia latipinna]XP_016521066.1 PREDICTED: uncharacterized protein LOC107834360 [Poecilia formosa]